MEYKATIEEENKEIAKRYKNLLKETYQTLNDNDKRCAYDKMDRHEQSKLYKYLKKQFEHIFTKTYVKNIVDLLYSDEEQFEDDINHLNLNKIYNRIVKLVKTNNIIIKTSLENYYNNVPIKYQNNIITPLEHTKQINGMNVILEFKQHNEYITTNNYDLQLNLKIDKFIKQYGGYVKFKHLHGKTIKLYIKKDKFQYTLNNMGLLVTDEIRGDLIVNVS